MSSDPANTDDDEVESQITNPGYPGALIMLAVPVLAVGVTAAIGGSWIVAGILTTSGAGMVGQAIRVRRLQNRRAD